MAKRSADKKSRPGRLRIVAGNWRSRLLEIVDAPDLRPTSERIRDVSYLIRQEDSPSGLRTNDRKFAIIKERIRLVVGTDVDSESDSE